jgi:BASS family bile acid:Na+ symporter
MKRVKYRRVMPDLILWAIKFGLFAGTIVLMFAQGLDIPLNHLAYFRKHPGLLLRSLIAVVVLVPAAALLIILLIRPSSAVMVGLAILAASPAAPQMIVSIPKAGGKLAYTASLHLVLGILSLVTTPVILALLAVALNFQASVHPFEIAELVGTSLFIPLLLGILFLAGFPRAASSIRMPLIIIGQAISLLTIALILYLKYHALLQMDLRSYSAMAMMIVVALGIGHFLAPRQPEERTTLALESAARHPGLAFLIAALNFPLEKALPVFIPYLVVFAVVSLLYIQWRKRTMASSIKNSGVK